MVVVIRLKHAIITISGIWDGMPWFDLTDSNSYSTPTSTHPHPHTPSKQPVAHNFIFSLLSSLLYSTKSPSSFSDRSIYFPFLFQWEGCGPTFALTTMISYFNYCYYWIIGLFNLKESFLVLLVLCCVLLSPGVPRPCLCLPETSKFLSFPPFVLVFYILFSFIYSCFVCAMPLLLFYFSGF